ncbi:MAG: peptide chain release factor N(5)-glutamine methyltransferase [Fimbriimonadales bacterium]|nr:MAG: release factor glutamine methyltransferase [Fimbriimonadales bacterium]
MTAQQAVQWAQAQLQAAEIEDAPREAHALVAACLGWERARLIAHPDARLNGAQIRRLHRWTRRRAAREPLAYLTRRAWFYGLPLTVGRGALIPRPETELLVERFLHWAKQDALTPCPSPTVQERGDAPVLVDAGTGTGAIALACLTHAPGWRAIGVDRSRRALRYAQINRRALGLESRLLLAQSNWLRGLRNTSVDAVLSNPPYVLPDEWDALPPEAARYEPKGALLAPAHDPLQPYRRIARDARRVLRTGGLLAFETSPRLAPLIAAQLPAWGFAQPQIMHDYAGAMRVVWAITT